MSTEEKKKLSPAELIDELEAIFCQVLEQSDWKAYERALDVLIAAGVEKHGPERMQVAVHKSYLRAIEAVIKAAELELLEKFENPEAGIH